MNVQGWVIDILNDIHLILKFHLVARERALPTVFTLSSHDVQLDHT